MYIYNAMLHAGIGRAYPALADRSVTIRLEKALPAEPWVSVLYEPELQRTGKDIGEWLNGPAERGLLEKQPRMAAIEGDPRHQLKMAPLAAVAAIAGIYDHFLAAEKEIQSGIKASPMPSRADMLIRDLTPLAGQLITGEEIRALLPGQFPQGRVGDVIIAGLLREAGIPSQTSNGMRGYRMGENTEHRTQNGLIAAQS
jgi:hypothetical protein